MTVPVLPLQEPITTLKAVGPTIATRLEKLGIRTITDLLFYFPFRYEDFSEISQIGDLVPPTTATIKGRIIGVDVRRSWKRRMMLTDALISDDTGSVKAMWFNQAFIANNLSTGDVVYLSGKVTLVKGLPVFANPLYEKARVSGETMHTARIVPMYSLTDGVTQKQLRWFMTQALPAATQLVDWLPQSVRDSVNMAGLSEALRHAHFPDDQAQLEASLQRLKFDELFLFILQSLLMRQELQRGTAVSVAFHESETKKFVSQLPFQLTDDQRQSAWSILQDIGKARPMNRLLEGEVGSGKTVVAAMVMHTVALNGYQTVLMAPTEILAEQHFRTLQALLQPVLLPAKGGERRLQLALVTRSHQKLNEHDMPKARLLQLIEKGDVDVVIGTHALLQELVRFKRIAVTIIDEQHRFGVDQRKILHDKAGGTTVPHFLSMTATPIPRSLALTLYGDLDVSVIKQLPSNRKKIVTTLVAPTDRNKQYDFVLEQLKLGRQVYVVCPLIDPSDRLGAASVTEEAERLKTIFKNYTVGVLHGKLKSEDKDTVMHDFINKRSQILVATSVIEVGINVPNATVIMIEAAERFGMAQLYQLRGRVGRGEHQSYCLLLPQNMGDKTKQRLEAFMKAKDSFELAELDLQMRGPGELWGTGQSGWPSFRLASVLDHEMVIAARTEAQRILTEDPALTSHPLLANQLKRWETEVHFE